MVGLANMERRGRLAAGAGGGGGADERAAGPSCTWTLAGWLKGLNTHEALAAALRAGEKEEALPFERVARLSEGEVAVRLKATSEALLGALQVAPNGDLAFSAAAELIVN